MQVQSVCLGIVSSFNNIPSYLVSVTNQTIHVIGLAALKIFAALMAFYELCKLPFSKAGPSVPHNFKFKQDNSLEARKGGASDLSKAFPARIAVIVERHFASKAPAINKTKFLAPHEITATKFKDELKKKFPPSQQDIAFFIDNGENTAIPLTNGDMKTIADKYRNEDGFLYIYYTSLGERV